MADSRTPNIDEILLHFEQLEQRLFFQQDCFLVTYTRTVGDDLLEGTPMPAVRYLNGRHKNVWLVESFLTTENSQNLTQRIQYFARKGEIWEWRESSNSGVVVAFEKGRNIYQNWYFFHNFGITPYRAIAEDNGVSYPELLELAKSESTLFPLQNELLPDCLKTNVADYRFRPNRENVENCLCWVLERPGIDTIWIDPAVGNAIRKRTTFWGPGEPQKFEIFNRKFKEVEPGLFLPLEQEITQYIGREMGMKESLLGKPFYHFIYSVEDIQIGVLDKVAREKLTLRPPVGTSVFDVRTEDYYTISDEDADPFAGPIRQGIKVNRFIRIRSILIMVGSVLIFLALWRILRKKESETKS